MPSRRPAGWETTSCPNAKSRPITTRNVSPISSAQARFVRNPKIQEAAMMMIPAQTREAFYRQFWGNCSGFSGPQDARK